MKKLEVKSFIKLVVFFFLDSVILIKVVFIQPRYFEDCSVSVWVSRMPPLGMAYMASILKKEGHEVEIIDTEVMNLSYNELEALLKRKKADVYGIKTTTPIINNTSKCAKIVRMIHPDATIVVGGSHATLEPEDTFRRVPEADFLLRGEAEYTFTELINALEKKKSFNEIKKISGIGINKRGNTYISSEMTKIKDLDKLPLPAYELLPMDKYFDPLSTTLGSGFMVMSGRGCPYNCTFCEEPIIYGNCYRIMSPERVFKEIEVLVDNYKIKHLMFHDSTLNVDMDRLKRLCDLIIEKKIKIEWRCKARVDHIDEELLIKMKKAGCKTISFGVETASEDMLKFIKKNYTINQVKKAFKLANKVGLDILGFFMMGFPEETKQDILKTINLAKELNPDYAEFTIAVPLPKSEFYTQVKDKLKTDDWGQYYQWNYVSNCARVSRGEMEKLYRKAYISFYLRPGFILKKLFKIRSTGDLIIDVRYFLFFLKKLVTKTRFDGDL